MNFLGHLYLSGNDDEIKIGNFIGDFVKGNPYDLYSGKIAEGIVLHREIDRYTDSHPISQQSKHRLSGKYRHYAGVIIDIYYDHFLAANWSNYSELSLEDYARECYQLMVVNEKRLPKRARYMLNYMVRGNWLTGYAGFGGIQKTLEGMSQRTKFESKMEEAVHELKDNYQSFESEFFTFFADIEHHVNQLRSSNE